MDAFHLWHCQDFKNLTSFTRRDEIVIFYDTCSAPSNSREHNQNRSYLSRCLLYIPNRRMGSSWWITLDLFCVVSSKNAVQEHVFLFTDWTNHAVTWKRRHKGIKFKTMHLQFNRKAMNWSTNEVKIWNTTPRNTLVCDLLRCIVREWIHKNECLLSRVCFSKKMIVFYAIIWHS